MRSAGTRRSPTSRAARAARSIRDQLDPEGAARRFDQRFEARLFRMWVDHDGVHRATISFDDHMAAWVRTITDTALRPRRGGPRFVDPGEKARAERLATDFRTNDQLTYDLIMDTLRAGALADERAVFGARQAGVRVVTVTDATAAGGVLHAGAGAPVVGITEDDQVTLPGWLIDQQICDPFGYRMQNSTLIPVPEHATLVRQATDRILAGDSLYRVVRDWNEAGVPSAKGTKWATTALR